MNYRLLCDENVDPAAVHALAERDIEAVHVTEKPGASSTDEAVATVATAEDRLLVTNDDFLDRSEFPAVRVLYYPKNRLSAHEVAHRMARLAANVPDPTDLPREMFLTEDNVDF